MAAAIVESISQGAAIALVAALLLRGLRNASAHARYLIACTALALLATTWVTTVVRHAYVSVVADIAMPADVSDSAATSLHSEEIAVAATSIAGGVKTTRRWTLSAWRTYADAWAIVIVAIWLLGVCFFSARLTLAWSQVIRLRYGARDGGAATVDVVIWRRPGDATARAREN